MMSMMKCTTFGAKVSSTRVARKNLVVRANEGNNTPTPTPSVAPVVPTPAPVVPPTPAPVKPSFGSLMAFSGPAPELINGRLAMLGFVAAIAPEVYKQEAVATQIGENFPLILALVALITAASFFPLFKDGKTKNEYMTSAEMLNGRAAMVGFGSLLLIETISSGQALF